MSAGSIEPFELDYEGWTIKGDRYAGTTAHNALYLHGAGTSSRTGYLIPRQELQSRGVGTTAFDCVGHGESGGAITDSSLASRSRQVDAVIAARRVPEPLTVFGTSMGAYDAIKLTERREVAALVLIVPGVFTPQAYDKPFGPQFSTVIRRERSWADTDAWHILGEFSGSLLVIAAEDDAVIPREIPERLVKAATRARSRHLHVVPGARHNWLFSHMRATPPMLEQTMALIGACIGFSS
jgi:uncharacterized protein